jgi:UDP-N-acetylglucosamine 2-epimerase
LVMRDTTERPEAVTAGTVKLVGTNQDVIVNEINKLLDNDDAYLKMSFAHNPYGDGHACKHIIESMFDSVQPIKLGTDFLTEIKVFNQ